MDRLARGLAWKGGAVTVVLLLLLIVLWANLNSMITENCINQLFSEVPSPDGKFKAVVFQRKCSIDTPPPVPMYRCCRQPNRSPTARAMCLLPKAVPEEPV